jgi:transposase
MGKSRRKHSREFKIEAVKQVVEHGRSVAEVAAGLGVNANMLSQWKTQLAAEGAAAFPGNGKASATDEEVRRLRRELATAQMERDILKKAVAFFAKAKS